MKCLYCANFTMRESLKHANAGLGKCKAFSATITVFTPYSAEPECSKREPAKDKAAREAWVLKREGK